MATVQLDDVHKRYGEVRAVNGISFSCADKEFLVILGPSGAGKTSTLKMIAGLEPLTGGKIFVGGRLVNFIPPEKRDVAMVFETYALYPHLTVYDNIAFPLRSSMSRLSKEEIGRRVKETAELLQMGELLDRKPAELSGGQKQRVSLGRALAKRASLLLMDEPISHLDAKLRHHMRRELKKFQDALDTTVIYVTHDYLEALALADRIVVLNEGRIHQIGAPSDVYHRPADTFVASLLGQPQINLIPCAVRQRNGDKPALVSTDGSLEIPCSLPDGRERPKDAEVLLGVRPQHIRLSTNMDEAGTAGEVYVSERLGVKCLVEVKVGSHLLRVLTPKRGCRIGQPVKFRVSTNSIMLFDMQSRKNLSASA